MLFNVEKHKEIKEYIENFSKNFGNYSAKIVAAQIRDSMHLESWIDYVRETKE